jgi:hypothetical protein
LEVKIITKNKKNKLEQKKRKSRWPPSINFPWLSQFECKSIETLDLKRRFYKKNIVEEFYFQNFKMAD